MPIAMNQGFQDEPTSARELAEVLRNAQLDLDACRARGVTSDRQKLARRVDLLSHLLLSYQSAVVADDESVAQDH